MSGLDRTVASGVNASVGAKIACASRAFTLSLRSTRLVFENTKNEKMHVYPDIRLYGWPCVNCLLFWFRDYMRDIDATSIKEL